jgi:hypothetical protein
MKRLIGLVASAALATGLAMLSSSARAQGSAEVTITLRLTLNGTVPSTDNFFVTFPVNGIQFCLKGPLPAGQSTPPCVGGQTYVDTLQWPKGTTPVTFRFFRLINLANGGVSRQRFSQQTVIPTANRTVSAFFTYGAAASVQAPATGVAAPFPAGAGLVAAGLVLVLLCVPLRRLAALR